MLKGIYIAASGMNHQVAQLDEISANLANVNTSGYKRQELVGASFDGLVTQFSHPTPNNVAGAGVVDAGRFRIETQGALARTSNPLNFAITGQGYFQTQANGPQGPSYQVTRNGDFRMDPQGFLVTQTGDRVLAEDNQPIQLGNLGARPLHARPDGTLMAGNQPVAKLKVVAADPLSFPSSNLTAAALPGGFSIEQGFLEGSNVNVVTEMVKMINVNKAFSFGQKAITTQDNELNKTVNDLGKVQ